MKLTVFDSDKGDCLLLTDEKGTNMLVDGGLRKSYRNSVRSELGIMRDEDKRIDLVCISHIDSDHIGGVLGMLDDEVEWRVFDYHQSSPHGNKKKKEPAFHRPPGIEAIWHNAFHDQVGENHGEIEEMLAVSAGFLSSGEDENFNDIAERYRDLVTSKREAIRVSQRINTKQLDIPLNRDFGGKLAMVRKNKSAISLGNMDIYVIGPFAEDLDKLRNDWNKWLKKNKDAVKKLRRKALEDEEELSQADIRGLVDIGLTAAGGYGDRNRVTPSNLASLMLLVEEGEKTILLTGDGHAEDILKGLKHYGKLNDHDGIHVNVLKVQHHGSEHNTDEDFARKVTADHYIFCGNGAHENPDEGVVEFYVKSRIGKASEHSENHEVEYPFKFWFNSTSTAEGVKDKYNKHMKKLEDKMKDYKEESKDQLSYEFFDSAKMEISI